MNNLTIVAILIICVCSFLPHNVHTDPAPFTICEERASNSKDIKVDVSDCGSSTRCNLQRGSSSNFTLNFVPTQSSKNKLERAIVAIFPKKNGTYEVPYGAAEEIQNNTRIVTSLNLIDGVETDIPLVHNALFPVMKGAPAASLSVRYVIREKVENVPRNQKHWKLHPGQVFACVIIPVQLV